MQHAGILLHITIYKHFLRTNNKAITITMSIAYPYMCNIFLIGIFVLKFQINFHFRGLKDGRLFEEWALIRGGRLLDIPVHRVGTYSRWALIQVGA